MKSGPELLAAWLKRSKLSQRAGAATLGIDESYLSQLLDTRRVDKVPGLAKAVTIEEITGIPPRAWVARRPAESGRPKLKKRVNASVG